MPIKFRCQKCRQFLGISRSLAGQVVDCPTCGRATRVPNLDGSRKPIPAKPELDKADSSLLNALDQLAGLGTAPPAEPKRGGANESAAAVAKPDEAIPTEPLQPIAVVDPPTLDDGDSDRHPVVLEDPTEPLDSAAVLQSLADNARPVDPIPTGKAPNRLTILAVAGLSGLVCAVGGFFAGQGAASNAESRTTPDAEVAAAPVPAEPVAAGLGGRITFRRAGAECLPDKGARVIAWPVGTAPETPWPPDGFRSGDDTGAIAAAMKQLEDLGGAMCVVGEDGTFELPLQSGGEFNVFIVSRFGSQPDDADAADASEMARVKMCFAEPQRVIGKTQFVLLQVAFRGDTQQILDHVFEVAE